MEQQVGYDIQTVSGIKTFKSVSGCAITITGGTEIGHASGTYSHWNGYKVDVRPTTCVSSYITSRYAYYGVRADGATMYRPMVAVAPRRAGPLSSIRDATDGCSTASPVAIPGAHSATTPSASATSTGTARSIS